MKITRLLSFIIILLMIFIFSGCVSKKNLNDSLNTPDKINMYADSNQKQIIRDKSEYEQTLFDNIITLINIRIPKQLSVQKSEISENDVIEAKEYSVEFIYDKPQSTTIDNGNKKDIQFTEIIFPLGEKWQNTAFIKIKDNSYAPVGLNENLDALVKSSVK